MTRLELLVALWEECGVSGSQPSTTINQTGLLSLLVNWNDRAWNEIQTKNEDWDWMRSSNILGDGMSFQTVNLQTDYPLGTGAGTCGVASSVFTTTRGIYDETPMKCINFDSWRDAFMLGAMRNAPTRPTVVAIGPDKSICLQPPTGAYTITGDYYVKASAMMFDDDEPVGLPPEYHMLIVYRAMMKFGRYDSAAEVLEGGRGEYANLLGSLESKQLPKITAVGAWV